RRRAQAVRPTDRRVPAGASHAGGQPGRAVRGALHGDRRGAPARRGAQRIHRGVLLQAVRLRDVRPRGADLRRRRLHQRLRHRALLPRRPPVPPLRRYQPDPADRDRQEHGARKAMTHPRSAFGASPSRGRHQRPGKAGSAVARAEHDNPQGDSPMKISRIRRAALLAALSALLAPAGTALAQAASYPSQPIKFVVPYPAGGATGNNFVAKANADGYTVLVCITALIQQPPLMDKLPYDPLKDFAPVTFIARSPSMFAVPLDSPAKS